MQTAAPIAASDRNLIASARAIAAATTFPSQRAYLEAQGSSYAGSPDLLLIAAAVLGRAQHDLRALADRLEHEITRHHELAAQQAVAHAKLYDLEAQLNA